MYGLASFQSAVNTSRFALVDECSAKADQHGFRMIHFESPKTTDVLILRVRRTTCTRPLELMIPVAEFASRGCFLDMCLADMCGHRWQSDWFIAMTVIFHRRVSKHHIELAVGRGDEHSLGLEQSEDSVCAALELVGVQMLDNLDESDHVELTRESFDKVAVGVCNVASCS